MSGLPRVGNPLGPVGHRPDAVELFQYSAVLWNSHRIHYDADYTRDVAGHPAVVVPGPLQGTYLEQLLTGWARPGRLVELRYRNRASAYVDEELLAHGRVLEVGTDGRTVRCEVWLATADGRTTTTGEGTVELGWT
ncbi:MAG: acyl dehydratase [Pseudonocardiales bacterium]|nr:acyl dehydratase [Pseudonocardiales bacterium]